ncbi:MAG TPA: hypothetical protein VG124_15025 [Beijerinckiaceae bacterium]|nr:hypothetical protein [Beijerinckiaceae bacterium]
MSKQNPIRAHTATNFRYFSDRLLAVAILFYFAHQAKVRRRWREQEIPAAVLGLINGQWKAGGSGTSA